MKRRLLASVVGALMLLLTLGALAANADDGIQAAGQSATSGQQASAASGATQTDPSNTNIDVRVLSPGDNGSVTQTNSASSNATSSNSNDTDQSASQNQSGSGGIQTANQWAGNTQVAGSLSAASQTGASNTNIPVRVLSPGNDGNVTQSNTVSSTASSTNSNDTDQDAHQTQGGSSCGCQGAPSGIQTSDQSAASGQGGAALSGATQTDPANASDPTAVGSKGDAGTTSQSNSDSSNATSTNTNSTDQDSSQSQAGSGSGIQTSDQSAGNEQTAIAASSASQVKPTNTNISVRVLSPGNDGNVTQTNSVSSTAKASNTNSTDQSSDQDPRDGGSCGCTSAPAGIQVAKQTASNDQTAAALSAASQTGAKNENIPVRVLSPGNGGSVNQSNDVSSTASASNDNSTDQSVDQDQSSHSGCGCAGGEGIQIADQSSWSKQGAGALSFADQKGAQNDNSPVRVLSKGDDGSVSQSNSADSTASARNSNYTDQDADQAQSSGDRKPCGCSDGLGIQVLGQKSVNEQGAFAASAAVQDFGKSECGCHSAGNTNDPVRVWSPGSDGSVSQTNSADSKASADNSNSTDQDADQHQSGGSGIGIQALGQESDNGQLAVALSGAFQLHPSNTNDPTRVYSPGAGGSVYQSNTADSYAKAKNTNDTDQDASQSQYGSGGCGCSSGLDIQALGQSATNWQSAFALSAALQLAPTNANGGAAVWSPSLGKGGSTWQANAADSTARGTDRNDADQDARQYES